MSTLQASDASVSTQQSSALSLLSLLSESSKPLVHAALVKLLPVVDSLWHEFSSYIPALEGISEDPDYGQETRAVASAVASRVFFHLEEYRDALRLALGAGDKYFNVVAEKTPYIETLVCKAIEIYTKSARGGADDDDDDDGDAFLLDDDHGRDNQDGMNEKVVEVVEKMFERCYADRQWAHALGIALEAKSIDKVKEVFDRCASNLNEKVATLKYGLSVCTSVVTKNFRIDALKVIAANFRGLPASHFDYASLCHCDHILGNTDSVCSMVSDLVKLGGESALLAFQLCFDLVDTGDQHFVSALMTALDRAVDAKDESIATDYAKCKQILMGGFAGELELAFLYKESNYDPLIMANLKKSLEEKSSRSSMLHSMSIHAHSFLNAGTTNDGFLRENLDFLKKANHWAKFSAVAGLGCIHQGHVGEAMELLEPYLPTEGAAVATNSGYSEGGSLMALGLIHAKSNCANEKRSETTTYLRRQLSVNTSNETMCHGAAMGIGLASLGSRNNDVFNELKEVLFNDSAVAGEACGVAMGLVMLGNAGSAGESVTEMLSYAKDTTHEKIIRGLGLGIALMNYRLESDADGIVEQLTRDRDPILRYGGMYTIALAYCGTGSNKATRKLLNVAVSDVSNEVRMAAIIGLAFVLYKTPERVPELVKLLLVSFNPNVRYASCMAVGIAMAGTSDPEVLSILEPMLDDLTDFVRQGALIATSMVLLQSSDNNKKAKAFRTRITSIVSEKHQAPLTKMGAILAQGIIDAGGRNVTLKMESRNGFTKPTSVIGLMLFCQHWFWHPTLSLLGLAFQPTLVAGLNGDMKFVKKFTITCNSRPSQFAYPAKLEEKKEEEKKRITTVTLSTTAKAKAKEKEKKKKEEGDAMEVEVEQNANKDEEEGEGGKKEQAAAAAAAAESSGQDVAGEKKKVKKVPEPKSFELSNPSRMTKAQVSCCVTNAGQRYSPILPGSVNGIIVLTDATPALEDDEVELVKAPTVEEGTAPMPESFIWRPSEADSTNNGGGEEEKSDAEQKTDGEKGAGEAEKSDE